MRPTPPNTGNVSLVDESACRAFEQAWRSGQRTPIERFLPDPEAPSYQATLEELIHIELELAWKALGQPDPSSDQTLLKPPRVEEYVNRFERIREPVVLRRLLEQEYRVRHRYGDRPASKEYALRFPSVIGAGEDLILTSMDLDVTRPAPALPAGVSSAWQVGRNVDHYQLQAEHARGGMGVIWRANDQELGREVALKQLKPDLVTDERAQRRFIAEARLTAQLEHPGIVPIYDLGHLNSAEPYYTMKLVRGRTLAEEILRLHAEANGNQRLVDQLRLLTAFLAVTRAMAYAHAHGIIHRDLKPENIILGDFGETLILDWGLAKVVDQDAAPMTTASLLQDDMQVTQRGAILGTPVYMAPEQISGRINEIDARSDVYALGAILYQLLTGQRPFEAATFPELQRQVLESRPVPPRSIQPAIPHALQAISLKALNQRPEQRYSTAAEMAADLERHLADEPVAAYREPLHLRLARWGRRHRVLVATAAVACLLVTLAGLGGLLLWERMEQRRQHEAFTHLTRLRSAAEADGGLARAETQAGRFASAVKILDQASERIEDQAELKDLHSRLQAQRARAFRVADFYRLLHETWHLSFREQDLLAAAAAERGLRALEIFEHPQWWQALPMDDLTVGQQEQLRQDTFEMFHLLAAMRAKLGMINFGRQEANEHCRAALALVERIQAYQPSQTIRLIEVISLAMLGEIDKVQPFAHAKPTHPTDQFFFGMIHIFVGMLPDNFLVKALFQPVTRHVLALDMKDPKGTGKWLLQSAITRQPSHYGYYIWLGMALLAEKDFAGSELAFSAAVAVRPTEYWTYGFRGLALVLQVRATMEPEQRRRLAQRALQNLDRAIELDPGEAINHWFKADMHVWLDQRAEAIKAIARYFETVRPLRLATDWPDSTGLFGGSVTAQRQNIQAGITYIQKALEQDPQDAAACHALALGKLAEDETDAAAEAAELVLKQRPADGRALAIRGAARRQRGQLDPALADFDAALKTDPDNHLAAAGRAAILEQRGQHQEALAGYGQALGIAWADWQRLQNHLGRARMFVVLGQPVQARQALEAARAINFRVADQQSDELFPATK